MASWAETERKIRAELPNLLKTRREVNELLDPTPDRYTRNISIKYPGFIEWLTDLAPERILPLKRSLRKLKDDVQLYQHLKTRYETWTRARLGAIEKRLSGRAIMAEIASSPRQHELNIVPYEPDDDDDYNASSTPDDRQAATATGMPIMDKRGKPQGGSGLGTGSDVDVHFTPDMWGPFTNGGKHPPTGPGSGADDVLFHELVHAGRQMRGYNYRLGVNAGFHNEEEYLAVVITNIYMSEKGKTDLRASHEGYAVLKNPEKFLDRKDINLDPRTLLERLRLRQCSLYKKLADMYPSEAKFNPVRQYEAERQAKATKGHPVGTCSK